MLQQTQVFFHFYGLIRLCSSFAAFVFYDSFACSMAPNSIHTISTNTNFHSVRDCLTQCHRFFFLSLHFYCYCLVYVTEFLSIFSVDYFVSVERRFYFFFLFLFSFIFIFFFLFVIYFDIIICSLCKLHIGSEREIETNIES